MAECSPDVMACVQAIVGTWYNKQAELKQTMCDAETKCQPAPNEQCDQQFEQLHQAGMACYEANKDKLDTAKDICKGMPIIILIICSLQPVYLMTCRRFSQRKKARVTLLILLSLPRRQRVTRSL